MPVASKNKRTFSAASLIFLHLLIVLPLAYFLNIWADEASTLYTTQHGFMHAFHNAATDEKQAPLYFWILSLWRSIDGSIFFARLFSVICSLTAIKVFADGTRRIFPPKTALLASAFFAFHPFLIWASLEIRVYALVVLLSIILSRLFFEAFINEADTKRQNTARAIFLFASIIALYTNYYLGFLLIGFFAALLISRRWRSSVIYLGMMFVAAVAFCPLLFVLKSQFVANTSGYQEQRSLLEGVRYLWHHFLTYILPTEIFPDSQLSVVDVVRLWIIRIAIIVIGFLTVTKRKSISPNTISLGVLMAAIFACLLLAYFALGSSYIEIRHASIAFVPLILFAASLLSDLTASLNKRHLVSGKLLMAAVALVVLASFSSGLMTLYPNMAKRGDWARVGAFIHENEAPGQPIVVFTAFDALALPHHYHGENRILPDEGFFSYDQEAAFGSEDSLKNQTDFVISKIPVDADMIWLAVSEKCLVTEACRPLENYVQANYTIEREQEFYLEKVFLLRRKSK